MWLLLLSTLSAHAEDLHTVCRWSDARWERNAALLLPGTLVPYAQATYHPEAKLEGVLGQDAYSALRFRVTLTGEDLTLTADLDYNEDTVFRLSGEAVPLGGAGRLLPGGSLQIGAVSEGNLVISSSRFSRDDLVLWDPYAVVPCAQLNVHHLQTWIEDREVLVAGGHPRDLPERVLVGRAVLRDAPKGHRIGRFKAVDYKRRVYLLEEEAGWSHVLQPHWTGVLWEGWVRSSALAPPPEPGSDSVGILGALGGLRASEPVRTRTCKQDLPLFAEARGERRQVGLVLAGTAMSTGALRGDEVEVGFPGGWIFPAEGARLLVDEDVMRCAEGSYTAPTLEELLGAGALDEAFEGALRGETVEGLDEVLAPAGESEE